VILDAAESRDAARAILDGHGVVIGRPEDASAMEIDDNGRPYEVASVARSDP